MHADAINTVVGTVLACCAECCIGCIEGMVEYFNRYAYIEIGGYAFSFSVSR